MDQSWYKNKGADDCAMEECYHVGLDQVMSLSEVDLMELLEDLPPSDLVDGDLDRLSHVIRSLEAEIGGGAAAAMADDESTTGPSSEHGGRLEDMLPDLDVDDYGSGSLGYWPPELPTLVHEEEGWCLYADECEGSVVGYEAMIDHQHYYEEGSTEQVYCSLWE